MILSLGVVDVAYSDASSSVAKTTGDVAELLEDRYHIMATFFELRREKIAGFLANDMAASIQRLVNGGPAIDKRSSLTYGADQKIEAMFRSFLDANEMSRLQKAFTGVGLSAAAEAGVSHRKKHPYAQANKARPAFIDTGLYRISFRAWTTVAPSGDTSAANRFASVQSGATAAGYLARSQSGAVLI
jgi:hypothetical protein